MADSRLRLQPLTVSPHREREIYTGWDDALHTYFAQVIDGQDEDGEDVLTVDLGNDVGEITDAADVVEALRPHAVIPDHLPLLLEQSKAATSATIGDLRPGSPRARRDARDLAPSRLHRPGGHITHLDRHDAASNLDSNGWDPTSVLTRDAHTSAEAAEHQVDRLLEQLFGPGETTEHWFDASRQPDGSTSSTTDETRLDDDTSLGEQGFGNGLGH